LGFHGHPVIHRFPTTSVTPRISHPSDREQFALEGPNEPGNFAFSYNGVNTANSWSAVAGFQHDWYAAVKADPNLSGVPVWTPSARWSGVG
jgi:hypothetical protein